MKQPWDQVRFRVSHWDTDPPESGDELITARGSRYQILEVKRRGEEIKALVLLVLPKDAPVQGRVFLWTWDKRKRSCHG